MLYWASEHRGGPVTPPSTGICLLLPVGVCLDPVPVMPGSVAHVSEVPFLAPASLVTPCVKCGGTRRRIPISEELAAWLRKKELVLNTLQ